MVDIEHTLQFLRLRDYFGINFANSLSASLFSLFFLFGGFERNGYFIIGLWNAFLFRILFTSFFIYLFITIKRDRFFFKSNLIKFQLINSNGKENWKIYPFKIYVFSLFNEFSSLKRIDKILYEGVEEFKRNTHRESFLSKKLRIWRSIPRNQSHTIHE